MMSERIDSAELAKLLTECAPGPWSARASEHGWLVCGGFGDSLAALAHQTGHRSADEQTANAKLIAILPDLVAELLERRRSQAQPDDPAALFDAAWAYWDGDDEENIGEGPEKVMECVDHYEVMEIASVLAGPTRYAFKAPAAVPGTITVHHYATSEEAEAAADAMLAVADPGGGR